MNVDKIKYYIRNIITAYCVCVFLKYFQFDFICNKLHKRIQDDGLNTILNTVIIYTFNI